MENFYTAYTKVIENKTFYFVKKYLAFPEYKDVEPVLENYGMHTDFNKACIIAGIKDSVLQEKLFLEAEATKPHAKVIDLNTANFTGKTVAN